MMPCCESLEKLRYMGPRKRVWVDGLGDDEKCSPAGEVTGIMAIEFIIFRKFIQKINVKKSWLVDRFYHSFYYYYYLFNSFVDLSCLKISRDTTKLL